MKNLKLKLFVTGANGYVGKNFIQYAISKGHFVYAVSSKKQQKKDNRIKWLQGKFEKNWNLELKDSDVLVHFASAGVTKKNISLKEAYNVNVNKSLRLINNAFKNKCYNWVIAGSASEYGETLKLKKAVSIHSKADPKKNYDLTKYLFSQECHRFSRKHKSVKCRIMRIFPIYGKNEKSKRLYPSLLNAAKKENDFVITNGNSINEFNHIDDVVKKLLSACNFKVKNKQFPQIWHLSSGKEMTVKSFAKKQWLKLKAKGKLKFKDKIDYIPYNHFSDKKSLWKL